MDYPSGSTDAGVSVELYVRSLSPRVSRRRLERVVERLDRLAADGTVDDVRVLTTGDELPATPADAVCEYGEDLLNRVAVFEEWARLSDRSLGSLFERRTVSSQFTGEEHDALVMPTMVMAEYRDGALRYVAPCEEDGEQRTVEDRLDDLDLDESVADDGLRLATDAPSEHTTLGH